MARGGYKPGAGRPKKAELTLRSAAIAAGQTPLEYMLAVMNDPEADPARRDRAAIAAAPFVHPRIADNRFGKKDAAAEAAENAGDGSDWANDLATPLRVTRN